MRMKSTERLRILVVEDDEYILEANITGIKEWFPDAEVIGFNCGFDAQKEIEKNSDINLIVSDAQMPNGSGIELLKFCEQGNFKIPVIIFHGGKVSSDELMSSSKNCIAIVIKPEISKLEREIRKALL
jgi:DNA-binding NtrC family response regulator